MKSLNSMLRLGLVLAVLVGMPVLAMPEVNRKVTDWLRTNVASKLPSEFVSPLLGSSSPLKTEQPAASPLVVNPLVASPIAAVADERGLLPTRFEDTKLSPQEIPAPPPALFPAPQRTTGGLDDARPNDQPLRRVREIRQQLEELGAEYVLLESLEENQGERFRFYCLMYVDANSQATQPFEEIATNPQVAAESVLAKVQAWRRQGAVRR